MIDLYTAATPNGRKISIALEEMALDYTVHVVNLRAGEQKTPAFLAINPNGRIPAIIDQAAEGFAVFESGAILLYLAEKTGLYGGSDATSRSRIIQWLMFQMGGLGPMQGQANVFRHYFPERLPTVEARYVNETKRLYGVLDRELATRSYVAGPAYSIADMACLPWIAQCAWSGVDLAPFVHLSRWFERIGARPAVQRGLAVPPPPPPNVDGNIDRAATGRAMVMT